jgi:hypothetical protein
MKFPIPIALRDDLVLHATTRGDVPLLVRRPESFKENVAVLTDVLFIRGLKNALVVFLQVPGSWYSSCLSKCSCYIFHEHSPLALRSQLRNLHVLENFPDESTILETERLKLVVALPEMVTSYERWRVSFEGLVFLLLIFWNSSQIDGRLQFPAERCYLAYEFLAVKDIQDLTCSQWCTS